MPLVIVATVAEIDSAHEGDVALWRIPMSQDDKLLVMRSPAPHSHVQQALTPGRFDVLAEVTILVSAERQPIPVRTPNQSLHEDAALGCIGEQLRDAELLCPIDNLVGIAAPVGEHQEITDAQGANLID
jgi:hypothetical protein